MRRHWTEFRNAARNLPDHEPATGLTNDKFSVPLLRELGFGLLPATPGPEVHGKTYPINRFFGTTAIHLVGCGLSLDRRAAGVRGATTNPHGLVQEFLNRSPGHLWALVSNGLRFRVLRDNQALSRQSFLEFDLETMFAGEVYSDFVLLWMTAHATRFVPQTDNQPQSCWLEQWTRVAEEDGTRALGALRAGVEQALQILGEAFVSHPRNGALRDALRTQQLSLSDFHGQLLRLVYRLIFLFVAEDRTLDGVSLLHPRDESDTADVARRRYAAHYSTARLRDLAGRIKGTRHGDLWQQFNLLVGALSGDPRFAPVREHLALPTFGSFLWSPHSTRHLNAAPLGTPPADGTAASATGVELANADFLEALRHLAFTRQGKVLRPVDYKNLGAEELGGVYESLLALTAQISGDGHRFSFAEFAGNERKTSGSYYTPDSLVQCLLDSALDPVVEAALRDKTGPAAEEALLNLKVCDPAVGSGHFLVGAAHRLARHLARVRAQSAGESEPSPLLYQHALRDVIGRCLYGVDINPMSAELCRVSLWLEALEPGKPLSFLDHHIQVGNSLLGTTPALLQKGIPDDAFTAIEGDVSKIVSALKKSNKTERSEHTQASQKTQKVMFSATGPIKLGNLAAEFSRIEQAADDTAAGVAEKERQYSEFVRGSSYQYGRLLADLWCAVFVWKKDDSDLGKLCPTERDFRKVEVHAAAGLLPHVREEVQRLATQYQFFHWHLAFPEVFRLPDEGQTPENEQCGWNGGFDVMLGNPPWERIKLQEKEWFANRHPEITTATNASTRKRLIDSLRHTDPQLFSHFLDAIRHSECESSMLRKSDRYPLCGRGDVNVYAVFAEAMRQALNDFGRVGCVLPSGIATDDTTKFFFRDVVETDSLVCLYDFENRRGLFPAVDSRMKFCLFTARRRGSGGYAKAAFIFFAHQIEDIANTTRRFTLAAEDFQLLNPNTRTCPIFRSCHDAELTQAVYRRIPVLIRDEKTKCNTWGLRYTEMFHSAHDSVAFLPPHTTADENDPLLQYYEAKQMFHFDHRWAAYRGGQLIAPNKSDPTDVATGQYVVHRSFVTNKLAGRWDRRWRLAWRDITANTNERTLVAGIVPEVVTTDKLPVGALTEVGHICELVSCLSSFVVDYVARQKMGGTMKFHVFKQLPVLPPSTFLQACAWANSPRSSKTHQSVLKSRVLELTYTAWDLLPFGQDCGYSGPPFRWDEDRRFLLRAELDAAFFHLYLRADAAGDWIPARQADGCPYDESAEDLARLKESFPKPRDAVAYIMDTFPIVRRKDEEKYNGDYRTKRVILEIYDAMQEAIRTGIPYQTPLDPPPGPPTTPLPAWNPGEPRPEGWPEHIHPPRGVGG
jgi:hypothetical protein